MCSMPSWENELNSISQYEFAKDIGSKGMNVFLHDNHRWSIPLAFAAQKKSLLPKPCTLIMFDYHHDCKIPNNLEQLKKLRKTGYNFEDLVALCANDLDPISGDWVIASMELGIVDHLVDFGYDRSYANMPSHFIDSTNFEHKIKLQWLPGQAMAYQGALSDICQRSSFQELWNILGWKLTPKVGFSLAPNNPPKWLNFDLDCFVIRWKEYHFVWPDEVFEREFNSISSYWSTRDQSGKSFLTGIINNAGLISMAREPGCCGSEENSDEVLGKLNRFIFDQKLVIQ
ncbi:hypothetical protein ACFLQW_01890 [Candidatus Zixiibacteriota bacterium]